MRAVIQPDKASHKLTLSEQPIPVPHHPDDVLIRVQATSPCSGELDWALWAPDFVGDKVPIPGQDMAGTVVSAPESSKFSTGDEVYCRITANRPGAAAEYTLARVSELALKPKNQSWTEAAATPLSALTAYQALFVQGNLDVEALKGEEKARRSNGEKRVLITAAAGSVGSWAVQLAKLAGAGAIVAVNGTNNVEFVRRLGATEVVDYHKQNVAEWASQDIAERQVDLVVDCVGGQTLAHCWIAVKEDGRFISICGQPEESKPAGVEKKDVHALWFVMESLGKNLDMVTELIEDGRARPVIDSVVEFKDFEQAWEKVESRHARGKVVLKVA
ncbi:hypothetical protein TruAng_003670 [Truncatella angustata]|nr:hypothetical protein TruAng_003670 [Truncatella angustata]